MILGDLVVQTEASSNENDLPRDQYSTVVSVSIADLLPYDEELGSQ